jgi:hypothetical protein
MEGRQTWLGEEDTDLTPRVVAVRRRANLVWFVGSIAASMAAAGISLFADREDTTPAAAEVQAQRIAGSIDTAARNAHVQADGIASTPVVRAGITTDASTMADIAATEIHFSHNPGETLEIFQIRGDAWTTLLRVPAEVAGIVHVKGRATQLENSGGGGLEVIAGAPISPQSADANDKTVGQVALSIPVDLAAARQQLSELVREAAISGVGQPISLVNKGGGTKTINIPIPISDEWKLPPMMLSAKLPSHRPKWVDPARFAALGLAGLMLIIFLNGLRKA